MSCFGTFLIFFSLLILFISLLGDLTSIIVGFVAKKFIQTQSNIAKQGTLSYIEKVLHGNEQI